MSGSRKILHLSDREHVLRRPNMYIGEITNVTDSLYIFDEETQTIKEKEFEYNAGLFKIFDEILDNAVDETEKDKTCNTIKVNIFKENDKYIISILNNGHGIEIQKDKTEGIYIPQLLFGYLRTSTNYDDTQERNVSGMNGIGAKGTNIFSKYFNIDIVCNKKHYKQTFRNNMSVVEEPKISDNKTLKSYVKISFCPDYERFGVSDLSEDMTQLFKKRVYDVAFYLMNKVKVYFNDSLINIKTFEDYINLYFKDVQNKNIVKYQNSKWKIAVIYIPNCGFKNISIVNGLTVNKGGNHIKHIVNQILNGEKGIISLINKKYKDLKIRPAYIKDNITIIVSCIIDKPKFNSQSKEELTNNITKANGVDLSVNDNKFINDLMKSDLIDDVVKTATFKESQILTKTDGKKGRREIIEKYNPAGWAGTAKSNQCLLIITEGDSAKTFGLWGIKQYEKQYGHGFDKFGIFPIRGKMLNVLNASTQQVAANKEITNIKKILGLEQNKIYNNETAKKLNYGGILILTDQDLDGYHISGLIINFIHTFWRELLQVDGFIKTLQTPILKAFKKGKKPIKFYHLSDFDKWIDESEEHKKYDIKYYKGLGTSTREEAMECFEDFDTKVLTYKWETQTLEKGTLLNILGSDSVDSPTKEKTVKRKVKKVIVDPTISDNSIDLAFNGDRVEDRKVWLSHYDEKAVYEARNGMIPYSAYFDNNFIHFSNYDNIRSIPSICDGLKPSQRKILYTVIKKNIKKSNNIKVSQLANKVSEMTCYLHGETSLSEAIVNMAQQFVGTNNINLLFPLGNFGTRNQGGKDCAASRYIFTYGTDLLDKIYRKEDNVILKNRVEENEVIEPYNYYSIVPMSLINGSIGIGTGYSTRIPMFNPNDVIDNLIKIIDGEEMKILKPWYYGFNGFIKKKRNENNYISIGKCKIQNSKRKGKIIITELPIGIWTEDYVNNIKKKIIASKTGKTEDGNIETETNIYLDIENRSSPDEVNITLTVEPSLIQDYQSKIYESKAGAINIDGEYISIELLMKIGLITHLNLSNMYLHDFEGNIRKYNTPEELINDFYIHRIVKYEERKLIYTQILENELNLLRWRIKFIDDYISKKIIIERKKKIEIIENLKKLNYPMLSTDYKAEEKDKNYNYIIDIKLFDLTLEKMEELENKFRAKKEEYEKYKKLNSKDIWKSELLELKKLYNSIY